MKKILFLSVMAAVLTFTGCKKNENVVNGDIPLKNGPTNGSVNNGIRSFADFDALHAEMDNINNFTFQDLVAYEQRIGFNSYGKLADQAMMPILEAVEKAEAQNQNPSIASALINQMLNASSQYVQMVTDENGENNCETKYFRSPYRYVMNSNRMFKVDTIYFKVFEGGHVSCGASHYNDLSRMTEADFSVLESDNIYDVFKYDDGRGNYGNSKTQTATNGNGKEKVNVRISIMKEETRPSGQNYLIIFSCYAKTWGSHKWCGIWWSSHRTYSLDISSAVFKVNNATYSGFCCKTQLAYSIEQLLLPRFGQICPTNNPNYYIHSALGWGKIPAVTCNINWQ